jgi:hypothetical protein
LEVAGEGKNADIRILVKGPTQINAPDLFGRGVHLMSGRYTVLEESFVLDLLKRAQLEERKKKQTDQYPCMAFLSKDRQKKLKKMMAKK